MKAFGVSCTELQDWESFEKNFSKKVRGKYVYRDLWLRLNQNGKDLKWLYRQLGGVIKPKNVRQEVKPKGSESKH